MIKDIKSGDLFSCDDKYLIILLNRKNKQYMSTYIISNDGISMIDNFPYNLASIRSCIDFLNNIYPNTKFVKNTENIKEIFDKFVNGSDQSGLY